MVERLKRYRKTGPSPKMHKLCYNLALLGLSDKQITEALEIPSSTFDNWKTRHPSFFEVLKKGKVIADGKVAHAMYKASCGYERDEVQILSNRVETYNSYGKVIESHTEALIIPIKKYYPPNTYAGNKWLSKRQREYWADTQKIEITNNTQINIQQIAEQLSDQKQFTTEEIRMALHLSMVDVIQKGKQLAIDN